MGSGNFGIDTKTVEFICSEIKSIKELNIETGIVVGGGNIFRGLGASERGMDRVTADNMGMLATVINSLALMDTLEQMGIYTRVMSAISMEAFAEPYIRRRAVRHMEKGRLVIFSAGTGNPYFTTDTAQWRLMLSYLSKLPMLMVFIQQTRKRLRMQNFSLN